MARGMVQQNELQWREAIYLVSSSRRHNRSSHLQQQRRLPLRSQKERLHQQKELVDRFTEGPFARPHCSLPSPCQS